MNEEHHQHFHQLMFALQQLAEVKYEKGQLDHGGNIWDKTDEELEAEELLEMIDLVIYRMTRIMKRKARIEQIERL